MTDKTYKVYISSTYKDLQQQRKDAAAAVRKLGHQPIAMEDYTSTSKKPVDKCLQDVRQCDIFIGIYALRYGYVPDGHEKSITEMEYEEAKNERIPQLVFMIDEVAEWPIIHIDIERERIDEFRKLVKEELTVSLLKDKKHLKEEVLAALSNSIKEHAHSITTRTPTEGIPVNLAYFNNRTKQEEELEDILRDTEILNEKPLVCLIHGNETECHEKLMERLCGDTLPEILDAPIDFKPVDWPTDEGNPTTRWNTLKARIAKEITGNRHAEEDEIVQKLNAYKQPLMISHILAVRGWQENEEELIQQWLSYWNGFPDLNRGRILLIFLCIKYRHTETSDETVVEEQSQLNVRAKKFVEGFKVEDYKNLTARSLTELQPVKYNDVDNWITKYAPKYCHTEQLRAKVRIFFDEQGINAISMVNLVEKLNGFLSMTQIREGFVQ